MRRTRASAILFAVGQPIDRRVALRLLLTGLGLSVTACARRVAGGELAPAAAVTPSPVLALPTTTSSTTSTTVLPAIPPPHPGPAKVISRGDPATGQLALTIDDGYSAETVAAYVAFADRTKIPITFSPNGRSGMAWIQKLDVLRPLVEQGLVQIANHTWSHADLTRLGEQAVVDEIERNEEWIEKMFGITARPWFRPPYGSHNALVRETAGKLGFTNILMWNGTFSDASNEGSEQLMDFARQYLHAGVIMLGHANQPAVTHVYDQIQELIAERNLQPVTLDTMFGTSRATG
jgi:peptidoglycan-N-acetylglucosamine deacetylase